jgi:C1A family cysteine protease
MNNARNDVTYRLGLNKFADMTHEEYKRMLGYKKITTNNNIVFLDPANDVEVDWRTKGVVNQVKDQGQCGSCWAFSAVASMESHYAIQFGKLYSLSEQELVDCSGSFGNEGCNGGDMDAAFKYVEGMPLETEDAYPYEAYDDSCRADKSKGVAQVKSFNDVAQNDPAQLKAAIAQGPVSVAIEADQFVFQFYDGGILNDESCGTELDHGVVAVGYGSDNGQEYFIVRNSWGASWGDNGYIKIANDGKQGSPGICGIASQPTYPIMVQP